MGSYESEKLIGIIKGDMDKLQDTVKRLVEEAYENGVHDGMQIKIPSQKEFEKTFKEPADFGEEGEWIVISAHLTKETAYSRIKNHLKQDWGWHDDDVLDIEHLHLRDISWKKYEGEYGYYIASRPEEGFWEAWVLETQ